MAVRYATAQPVDIGGTPVQNSTIPQAAVATTVSENGIASSVITVTDNTTDLEIAAVGSPVFVKWIGRGDTTASVLIAAGTANFDAVIQTGTVRRLVIPIERQVAASIVGANIANGLYNRVAFRTGGMGSILATQY